MTQIPERGTPRRRSRTTRGASRSGSEPATTDPLQRMLLSMQQTAGNRAVSELVPMLERARGAERIGRKGSTAASVQRKKVSDAHVGHDLRHKQAERLFTEDTMDWWGSLKKPKGGTSDKWTAEQVHAGRANIQYEQLRNTTLKSAQGLAAWLGRDSLEFMYVHEDKTIYTGGRDHEKLPHPTLVGGDPDAICAGTMQRDLPNKTIWVTNESGHFRPSSVDHRTVEYVEGVLPKPAAKGQARWKVKTRLV